jgi:hypothetical protein
LGVPDVREQAERDRKRGDAGEAGQQLVESLWHRQRDNEERDCEAEDGIAETLQPGHFAPALRLLRGRFRANGMGAHLRNDLLGRLAPNRQSKTACLRPTMLEKRAEFGSIPT